MTGSQDGIGDDSKRVYSWAYTGIKRKFRASGSVYWPVLADRREEKEP